MECVADVAKDSNPNDTGKGERAANEEDGDPFVDVLTRLLILPLTTGWSLAMWRAASTTKSVATIVFAAIECKRCSAATDAYDSVFGITVWRASLGWIALWGNCWLRNELNGRRFAQ